MLPSISKSLEEWTGVDGAFGYFVIVVLFLIGYSYIMSSAPKQALPREDEEEEEEPDPPRNFTAVQLRKFDGTGDNPLYLSVNKTVFDVSKAKDFYGPGGPYEIFAGRECGVALAKMSFDESHLDDYSGCSDDSLSHGEQAELDGWIEKFKYYRNYPVMGRLIAPDDMPSPTRSITKEEMELHKGDDELEELPDGYAALPIYLGAGTRVFDVSFGGVTFYGKGCSYNRFAGNNASRALAKMSFDPKDTANTDVSDLTEKEKNILADWIKTFEERKQYPCVGVMKDP